MVKSSKNQRGFSGKIWYHKRTVLLLADMPNRVNKIGIAQRVGCVVVADALNCQRETAEIIVSQGVVASRACRMGCGEYALVV